MQAVLVIIWFANWIYGYILYSWYRSVNSLFSRVLFVFLLSSLYLYYAINWVSWYLLIYHINTLKQLRDGKNYQEWRRKIRAVEFRACVLLAIFEFIYLWFNITLTILPYYSQPILNAVNRIIYTQLTIIFTSLSIWQFYLYRQLSHVMKTDLYFYFKEKWSQLKLMIRINVIYFIIFIFWNLSFLIWDLDIYKMIGIYKPYPLSFRIIFFYLISLQILLNIYLFISITMALTLKIGYLIFCLDTSRYKITKFHQYLFFRIAWTKLELILLVNEVMMVKKVIVF